MKPDQMLDLLEEKTKNETLSTAGLLAKKYKMQTIVKSVSSPDQMVADVLAELNKLGGGLSAKDKVLLLLEIVKEIKTKN